MFNGDNHQANQDVLRELDLERYRNDESDLENIHHPATSMAYFRVLWSAIEPRQGDYQWDYIDALLELSRQHGQTLMLRISPYKGRPIDDVPSWYRELVGDQREFEHIKWPVDPENPLYAEHFGNMIRELGKRYDGHPDLEAVDVSFVGWAGEGRRDRIAEYRGYAESGRCLHRIIQENTPDCIAKWQRRPMNTSPQNQQWAGGRIAWVILDSGQMSRMAGHTCMIIIPRPLQAST